MTANNSKNLDIILVGYEDQENIGLRSIMAYLISKNYNVSLIHFSKNNWSKIKILSLLNKPLIVGFSIIFQYSLNEFAKLIKYLRKEGVNSHFTAGGHFTTVCPKESLSIIPELDSIVRFEGEYTIIELLEHLKNKKQLHDINGLAFWDNSNIVVNKPRALISNLDSLPPIYRDKPKITNYGIRTASILASRGCYYNCSFCSIREFYGSTIGPLRRTRSPNAVVDEIEHLYNKMNVTFLIFQDDDFSTKNKFQKEWLDIFLRELKTRGLNEVIKWKISCRVDDIEPRIFEKMITCGLFAVYLGIESGSETGLKTLNKKVTVSQNLSAIKIIKDFDIALCIGFMLFDPYSTFLSVKENLMFLSEIGEDGYFPINFCKMLPYAGTPIQKELIIQNRLRGTISEPDYELLNSQLEWYSFTVNRIFKKRNFNNLGLVQQLHELMLCTRLLSINSPNKYVYIKNSLKKLTKDTNKLALDSLFELLYLFENKNVESLLKSKEEIIHIAEKEWKGEAAITNQLQCIEKNLLVT